jgi:hypothetical protein
MKHTFIYFLLGLTIAVLGYLLFRASNQASSQTQAEIDLPFQAMVSDRKMEAITTQVKDADVCASILAYGINNLEISEYFKKLRPSQVSVTRVVLSEDFEGLKFFTISEKGSDVTSELLVLVDTRDKTVVDAKQLNECVTVWIDNVSKSPRRFGVGLSTGEQLAFELRTDGFKQD